MNASTSLAGIRPQRFAETSYEVFRLNQGSTRLLDPLQAGSIAEAIAEITGRWSWDRGDRLGIREIGANLDRLHVYAVRKKSIGREAWTGFIPRIEHERWLDLICTVDLNVIAGIGVGLVGTEIELHERRQRARPDGAQTSTCPHCYEPIRRCRCDDLPEYDGGR